MKKTTGLAGFVKTPATTSPQVAPAADLAPAERKRGAKDKVALTVRLQRGDWMRVHQLALDEGVSIQDLAVRGLSKLFEERGLPGIVQS